MDPSGEEHPVEAEIGKHLLDVAHDNNIELEGRRPNCVCLLLAYWRTRSADSLRRNSQLCLIFGKGACGGELACSTCHLVFDQAVYDTLPPKSDEEEDMLDLAFELTET